MRSKLVKCSPSGRPLLLPMPLRLLPVEVHYLIRVIHLTHLALHPGIHSRRRPTLNPRRMEVDL